MEYIKEINPTNLNVSPSCVVLSNSEISKNITQYGRYKIAFFCSLDYSNSTNNPFTFTISNGNLTIVSKLIEKVPLSTLENWYYYEFIIDINDPKVNVLEFQGHLADTWSKALKAWTAFSTKAAPKASFRLKRFSLNNL